MQIIRTLWNIFNVKSPTSGFRKKDETRMVIRSSDDKSLLYLIDIENWIKAWDANADRKFCLSKETSLALRQTCSATVGLARYLLEEKGFDYVLLGKIQSDNIESRFGWYRQCCGGNFYLSIRQVLESEKCIRLISLAKFAQGSISDMIEGEKESDVDKYFIAVNADNIVDNLNKDIGIDCMEPSDQNVLFYIAGFMAKSLQSLLRCVSCSSNLIASDKQPKIQFESAGDQGSMTQFLDSLNRGGLKTPSDLCYLSCLYIYNFFNALIGNRTTRIELLETQHSRSIFCEAIFIGASSNIQGLFDCSCAKGHPFKNVMRKIGEKLFNILMKNWASNNNEILALNRKRRAPNGHGALERKAAKLQSLPGKS